MFKTVITIYSILQSRLRSEQGATLLELIVSFIILGIAIPSVILTIGHMGINHGKNESVYNAVGFANEKMEEIMAFKQRYNDWAIWANDINDFAGTETLSDGSQRVVTITNITNWINNGAVVKNAYRVNVLVTPIIGPSHSVSVILCVNY